MPKTLFDKIWASHEVMRFNDGTSLLYIDKHIVHEVTSPQAFEGLASAQRQIRNPQNIIATADHNVPTLDIDQGIKDRASRDQVAALTDNARKHQLCYFPLGHRNQGIVHIIGPEQGFTLPGLTLVCGDSHTATHGAFGAFAFGIGTSEIEQVFATQVLIRKKPKNMRIHIEGELGLGVSAKDIILYVIAKIGIGGATGHVIEYSGSTIDHLSMESRMTLCNMSIEAGAVAGMIAPDDTTFAYLRDKPMAPQGNLWKQAVSQWQQLHTEDSATFDSVVVVQAKDIEPFVTWGTNPEMALGITASIPDYTQIHTDPQSPTYQSFQRALAYMGLETSMPVEGIELDKVFIGSCTNARLEDLRAAAAIVNGKKIAKNIQQALVVPGSGLVKAAAEKEGLHTIFRNAGFEWRHPGCSMCLAMNADKLLPKERCASTSNRNFEGRQGRDSRTHLMSPAMAAAGAIAGCITDVRKMM